MADNHCFVGRREVGKTRLQTSSSASSSTSGRNSQKLSDILRMRRLRLGRAKTTNANSMSESVSEHRGHQSSASRTSSNSVASSVPSVMRQNSTNSYQSARSYQSTKSNATALTSLSGSERSSSRNSRGKLRRYSKYDEEISNDQLGINEKELVSMNKHIPALKSHGKSATFRQHYYPEGGWGWVITFCCFLANIFTTGIQLSFGLLFLEISKLCGEESTKMSIIWIGSTNLGVSHLISPLLVALCRRKSTRLTAVVGGLVMALALLFASFARHYHQIFLSYGLLFGLGCSMVRETSTLMLSQYFKRRRELVEMLSTAGTGLGIAIFSNIYHTGFSLLGWRFGLQAVAVAVTSLFFVGLFYRSASLYHPQRRAILHLKDMSKRKGKDKSKIESKPPYFDFSLMSARSFQVVLLSTAFSCLGACTPLFFFVPLAFDEGLLKDEAVALQSLLGLATSIGALGFGYVARSRSSQCMISRQYLLQASLFGIGLSILALVSVEGYHGYLLFVWMYGIFLGGFELSLKVYTFERVRVRQFTRGWGFVQGAKGLSYLIGIPISGYISEAGESPKAGIFFSFASIVFGATLLFLMECFRGHHYNMYNGMRHNELCKMDTGMTSSDANDHIGNGHSNQHPHRRPSDLGSVSEIGGGGSIRMNSIVNNSNGLAAELAHLQCTCDQSNGNIFNLIKPQPEPEVKSAESSKHDDVAVLEEEDVVLEEEELVKVDVLDEDEDEDEDEFNGPIYADEDEEEEEDEFVQIGDKVVFAPENSVNQKQVATYDHIYEGRNNLFGEVISEEDEDQEEDDDDEVPSKAFMWSEAVAAFEVDEEAVEDAGGAKQLRNFAHLKPSAIVAKRSRSESDLGRFLEGDLQTPSFVLQRLPASARPIETKSKQKKQLANSSSSGGHVDNGVDRNRLLGSVGHLLAQFKRQKTWHKFKTVHAAAVPTTTTTAATTATATGQETNDSDRSTSKTTVTGDVTTFV